MREVLSIIANICGAKAFDNLICIDLSFLNNFSMYMCPGVLFMFVKVCCSYFRKNM
jgi:hypothetical protein